MASKFSRVGKDGRTYWYVQGMGPDGRYSRAVGPVSEGEAEAHRIAAERDIERRAARPASVSAADALARFLQSREVARRSEATRGYYEQKLRPVFLALGSRPVKSWRAADLEGFLASKAAEWTGNNVRKVVGACRCFIRWARDRGLDVPDFCRGVSVPDPEPYEARAYEPEDVRRILDAAASTPLHLPIALAAYAGLTRADLLALTWEQVDLNAGLLRRRRHKTGVGRPIPIIGPLRAVLEACRATHGPVCRDLPTDTRSLDRALHRVLRRAGVEKGEESVGGWHRFRHTYATLLGAAGVDLATVGAMLQHRPGSPVTARYLHTSEDRMKAAGAAVEAAYRARG